MSGALAIEGTGSIGSALRMPFGLAGSVLFHLALLAALFTLTPMRSFIAPEPQPITVELIPAGAFDTVPAPDPSPSLPMPVPVDTPELPAATSIDGTAPSPGAPIHATTLYAAELLKSSQMAQVRRSLPTLQRGERIVQLCNIEALEQIRRAAPRYDPDTLVSYAMSQPVMAGSTLTALGAAFRSRRQWYGVSFTCTANATLDGVVDFSFTLGAIIPEDQWEAHNLNAEDKAE